MKLQLFLTWLQREPTEFRTVHERRDFSHLENILLYLVDKIEGKKKPSLNIEQVAKIEPGTTPWCLYWVTSISFSDIASLIKAANALRVLMERT